MTKRMRRSIVLLSIMLIISTLGMSSCVFYGFGRDYLTESDVQAMIDKE